MSRLISTLSPLPSITQQRSPIESTSRNSRRGSWSYLWLGTAVLLLLFANGRWIIPAAAWIWPVLLVRFLRTERLLWGLCLAASGMTAAAFVSWWGMVPAPVALYFLIMVAK